MQITIGGCESDSCMAENVVAIDDLLLALASSALVSIVMTFIGWGMGFFALQPQSFMPTKTVRWRHVFGAFTAFLAAEIFIMPSIYLAWVYLMRDSPVQADAFKLNAIAQGWMNIATMTCAAIILFLYCHFMEKSLLRSIWGFKAFEKKWSFLADAFAGAVSWLVAYPWTGFIGLLVALLLAFVYQGPHADQTAVKHLKAIMHNFWLFWTTTAAIVLLVPVLEELIFRGFLQEWLKGIFGYGKAILITSAIFALFHFSVSQGIDNLELLASLFALSCFLGFIKERRQSLWASIGLHSTFNLISIFLLLHQ